MWPTPLFTRVSRTGPKKSLLKNKKLRYCNAEVFQAVAVLGVVKTLVLDFPRLLAMA